MGRLHPLLLCAVGVLAVSTGSIFVRLAFAEGADPFTVALWRLTWSTAILAASGVLMGRPVAAPPGPGAAPPNPPGFGWVLASGCCLAAHFATWITSLRFTSQASSVVLVNTTPLWIALVSPWLLGDTTRRGVLVGGLVAFSGIVLVTLTDDYGTDAPSNPLWGKILAVMGAVSYAGHLMIGRFVRDRTPLLAYLTRTYAVAAAATAVLALAFQVPFVPPTLAAALWCVLLALVPQLVGHVSLNAAVRRLPAATVAFLALGEPAGATVLGLVVLGIRPGAAELLGAGVIMVGVVMAARAARDPANG